MQNDIPVPPGLADLDAFEVDNLLSYFNQPALPDGFAGPTGLINPQVPVMPRNPTGFDMAGYPMQLNPAANLFSTITIPQFQHADNSAGGGETGGGSDSGDGSNLDRDGKGGKNNPSIQEKNRRAQKRFRERQKAKMKDMTEHLDDLNSELSKLRMENNALKNRNSVLEKVLTLRDEHIRVMQDEQHVFDLGNPYLQNLNSQKMLTGPTELPPGTSSSSAIMAMDVKTIKSMPADVVINCWKDTVRDLGNILVQVEGCSDRNSKEFQEGMDALCRILDTAGQMCMNTAVLHPTNMQRLLAATLGDGRSGVSAEDRTRWASVACSLQLSESQRGQIISLRQIFLRRMNKVMEERRGILARLQTVNVPDRMMALQSVISETLKVNACTAELKANLQEEHLAGLELIGTVFKTIFSPIQKARAIVQSYPFYPDVFQIASALAEEGQQSLMLEYQTQNAGAATSDAPRQMIAAGGGDTMLTVPTAYRKN